MQGNQAKSLVGASDGFSGEMEKKYPVYKQKDFSICSRELRSLLVRLGRSRAISCQIANIFNIKQAELKESFLFQISPEYRLNTLGFLGGKMVKMISLIYQNQLPRFI